VFENRVLRRIVGLKREEEGHLIMKSFFIKYII
jgi:hypothetical protein